MKRLQQWAAVHELYRRGVPKKKIAEQLGMSRNTVKRLLRLKEEPRYHRTYYPSKLDGYKEQILEWRCSPYEFNGTRIFRELRSRGYAGSIGPVYRLLSKIDEDVGRTSSRATMRIETPPGDQAQFDWSPYEMEVGGIIREVYCFSLILAACRKKAVCFSLKSDAEAIYEAIQELFKDLGGVTLELLIDNPKALVLENKPKSEDEVRYNPHALLLAAHLGTELNACPCYWPRKKGKIEKPFQYIEEQFIKGNAFASMEELNWRGKNFINEWNQEKHTTTGRIPNEFYETEESHALLPLPSGWYCLKKGKPRKVSNDGLVSIEGNKYSVPIQYADKQVSYRILYGFRIEILDRKDSLIQTWEASDRKHGIKKIDSHYDEVRPRASTSIPQIRRDFTATFSYGASYLENAGRKFDQPTHHARKIMELQELYDTAVLDRFIAYAVEHDLMDIRSFKRLLKEKYRDIAFPVETEMPASSAQVLADGILRECSYYEEIGKENTNGCGCI